MTRLDQTCREPGLPGSTSVRSTGAIPNSAITAGSFASRFTPSWCGVCPRTGPGMTFQFTISAYGQGG